MSAIIRRRNSNLPARTMTKQEFLTPFDRIFDDMFGNMFPTIANDFGEDFLDGEQHTCVPELFWFATSINFYNNYESYFGELCQK